MSEKLVPEAKADEIYQNLGKYMDDGHLEESLRRWLESNNISSKEEVSSNSDDFRGEAWSYYTEEPEKGGYLKKNDIATFVEKDIDEDLIDSQVVEHFGESKEDLTITRWIQRANRTIVLEICLLIIEKKIMNN